MASDQHDNSTLMYTQCELHEIKDNIDEVCLLSILLAISIIAPTTATITTTAESMATTTATATATATAAAAAAIAIAIASCHAATRTGTGTGATDGVAPRGNPQLGSVL